LAFGGLKNTDRFKREDAYVSKIKSQFPDYKVDLTGHSLGNSLASELANKHNVTGSGFNGGFGIRGSINNPNFTNYRTSNDPVSFLGKLRGQKFVTVKGSGHGINNFI
jgi:surfactin synthase thioesterase subunit